MYRFTKSDRTYREADGKLIRGTFLEALFNSGTIWSSAGTSFSYVTGQIKIYTDGMIEC